MSAALRPHDPSSTPQAPTMDAAAAIALVDSISQRADKLGEAVDIAASIKDVVRAVFQRTESIQDVAAAAEEMIGVNESISATAGRVQESAVAVKEGLVTATTSIRGALSSAREDVTTMAETATTFSAILNEATATVQRVGESSDAINSIAREIQLIAINAGVEAARSGVAGRGFAVIANAVKDLAEQTRAATAENARQLVALGEAINRLAAESRNNEEKARTATAHSEAITQQLVEFDGFGRTVNRLVTDIEEIAQPVAENIRVCSHVVEELEALAAGVGESRRDFRSAARRIDELVATSQDLVGFIAEKAVNSKDGALVALAMDKAKAIGRMFEEAIDKGQAKLADLFDEDYRPIADSEPQQHMTRFVALTDRLLPPLQEAVLTADPRISFCAAVDRNGYLPTHNKQYSRPQGNDPVWNAANCRNRRIFNDRTGLAAGQNQKASLVQTYRRDMGGGQFALMKDISAPIRVKGRHWGGFRIGVKV